MAAKKIKKVTKKASNKSCEVKINQGLKAHDARADYQEILIEILASPNVRYVAGGITTALLARLANNWEDKYTEISSFIRENLENLETKFGLKKEEMVGTPRH